MDWVLREWEATLDGLERNPLDLADRLDWVMKRKVVEEYIKSGGVHGATTPCTRSTWNTTTSIRTSASSMACRKWARRIGSFRRSTSWTR